MISGAQDASSQPCAVLGAGNLISHLHRDSEGEYRFSMFRFRGDGTPTHALRASDLKDIVKLSQVMAFAIVDDDWVGSELRKQLSVLHEELAELTSGWDEVDDAEIAGA